MEYGFDNIFAEGPTPTPSMLQGEDEMLNLDEASLGLGQSMAGVSMTNVDGMNM